MIESKRDIAAHYERVLGINPQLHLSPAGHHSTGVRCILNGARLGYFILGLDSPFSTAFRKTSSISSGFMCATS